MLSSFVCMCVWQGAGWGWGVVWLIGCVCVRVCGSARARASVFSCLLCVCMYQSVCLCTLCAKGSAVCLSACVSVCFVSERKCHKKRNISQLQPEAINVKIS